jgi:hypothetical protein
MARASPQAAPAHMPRCWQRWHPSYICGRKGRQVRRRHPRCRNIRSVRTRPLGVARLGPVKRGPAAQARRQGPSHQASRFWPLACLCHVPVSRWHHVALPQRVPVRCIESRRHDDEVRRELARDREDHVPGAQQSTTADDSEPAHGATHQARTKAALGPSDGGQAAHQTKTSSSEAIIAGPKQH